MVNYKAYKIIDKIESDKSFNFVIFELLEYIDRGYIIDGKEAKATGFINCVNNPPYSNYRVGDWLEIDLDRIGNKGGGTVFDDTSIVRKVGSSAVVSSSSSSQQLTMDHFQAMGNQMMDRAERSGGEYEVAYIAQQEEQRKDGSVIKQVGWVYRKSK